PLAASGALPPTRTYPSRAALASAVPSLFESRNDLIPRRAVEPERLRRSYRGGHPLPGMRFWQARCAAWNCGGMTGEPPGAFGLLPDDFEPAAPGDDRGAAACTAT